MKQPALVAAGLVTVTAMSGAAAQVGLATADSAAPAQTKRYVLKEVVAKNLGRTTFAGSDRIKSKATGEVVGYDSFTGKFYPKKNKVVVNVGIALKGGIIVGRVAAQGDSNTFSGPILKGSGKFTGIDGTITGRDNQGTTVVVLRYRL